MIVAFFFDSARDVRGGTPAHQEAERPAAGQWEVSSVDILHGFVERPCFSLVSWVRSLGW